MPSNSKKKKTGYMYYLSKGTDNPKIFAKLPVTQPDTSKTNTTVLCQKFFYLLPSEFNRSTYLSTAERLHISPKTAEKYLRKLCNSGQLQHVTYGQYSKT